MAKEDQDHLERNLREVGFQVDGQILNELSKQVSSHLFALGELMKNSYDAEATKVNIVFDIKNRQLTVEDNGVGISEENLKSLLHIAKSGKEYGREFEFFEGEKTITRYTQGSKGLGLFCAFKFGDLVIWDTRFKGESYKLTVNKADIVGLPDISQIKIPIEESKRVSSGTAITISFELDSEIDYIYSFFLEGKNSKKIVKYFYADMEVSINLINKDGNREEGFPMVSMSSRMLNNEHSEAKFLDIDYDSESGKIVFTHKNGKTKVINHSFPDDIKKTSIEFHINAYLLKSGGIKKIDEIFHNKRGELSPLVYINGVMFNNDQFFDPSITRKIKTSKVLPQLTGFVRVICNNRELQFNNERTDLIQNAFNKKLKDSVNKLNVLIQEKGREFIKEIENSEKKKAAQDTNVVETPSAISPPLTEPPSEETQSVEVELTPKLEDGLLLEDSQLNLYKDSDPIITLTKSRDTFSFDEESDSINLYGYFLGAKDSQDKDIPIEEIKIFVDDVFALSPHISPISTNKQMSVKFSFKDPLKVDIEGKPFEASKILTLVFKKREKKFGADGGQNAEKFIEPLSPGYTVKLPGVGKLIDQINKLAENYEEYDYCIASSLRVLFDLTTVRYEQCIGGLTNGGLEFKVKEIIEIIKEDKGGGNRKGENFRLITEFFPIRHSIAKNIFEPGHIMEKVRLSNLGSHTGSEHVDYQTLRGIAQNAGYYAQLVDAHFKIKGLISK